MEKINPDLLEKIDENKKRKKEILIAICLAVLFLILTFVEVRLAYLSRELPFMHSIFFFGLVNFNIVLLLFLAFLVFRNVVKTFVERSGKIIGSSLKSKLIAAFVTFSFVPTVLMFFISVFYINSSFDKWFSIKTSAVLRDSLEITNSYYLTSKQKNYHFANQIIKGIEGKSEGEIKKQLDNYRSLYSLDVVEFYPGLFGERVSSISDNKTIPEIPKVSLEFLEKGIKKGTDSSTMHHFQEGSLIRVIAPLNYYANGQLNKGALVISTFVPISLISKMDEIASAYDNFRDINPLVSPIKTIYLVILCLMTMVIMLGATWFGFYLAKQLATPLASLGEAADQVAQGNYQPVDIQTGSQEINQLVKNFNRMTSSLAESEKEILEVNKNLKTTLDILDEHNRYIEVILSNVSAGVISIDHEGMITTMNPKAAQLLRVPADRYIGMDVSNVLTGQNRDTYSEIISQMKKNNFKTLQKELRIQIQEDSLLMKLTITMLKDERNKDLGLVIVFDDLTELVNAQRASAWREVARRIAHEIKNPLTPIKLSAQRLEKKFGAQVQDPAFQQCTAMIIKQVDELKNLVNEFSSFARLPQINPKLGSLNNLIQETLVLYSTGHKEMEFNFYPDPKLPNFEFDQDQIKRVVTNLLENAIDALNEAEAPKIEIVTLFDAQLGIVKTRIKDNGCGIETDMRDRIFEPYFSTRENGTGLGLAIVKRIIEDHHGFIRAFSNQPKGTEFVIELPVGQMKKTGAEDSREYENKA
ncbi:MAG: ATP-binding protein [Bdellovibrionota bacterium]